MTPERNIFLPRKYQRRGIDFFYEDRDVIVIVKDIGVLSTHTVRHEQFTAENAVTDYLRKGQARSAKRACCVHRLDRETSGVMVFAKNEQAAEFLREHWSENLKIYTALTNGVPERSEGILENWLAEDRDLYMNVVDRKTDGAKFCKTEYKVEEQIGRIAKVSIRLWTGRKNQIRTQFAHAKFPVLGDEKYSRVGKRRESRLYLHAKTLEFTSPSTGTRLHFEAAEPEIFARRISEEAKRVRRQPPGGAF